MRNLAKVETFDEAQYLANQNLTFTHYGDPATARGILGVPIPTVMKYILLLSQAMQEWRTHRTGAHRRSHGFKTQNSLHHCRVCRKIVWHRRIGG